MNDKTQRGAGRQWLALTLIALALVWALGGLWLRGRALAAWRQDYEWAALGKRHPVIARLVASERAARAAENFARAYDDLNGANVATAPVYVVVALVAHNELAASLDGGQGRGAAPEKLESSGGRGVRVDSVAADSRAARAGLLVGDVIVSYDGAPVSSVADLNAARDGAARQAWRVVNLVVMRDGSQVVLSIDAGQLGVTCSER